MRCIHDQVRPCSSVNCHDHPIEYAELQSIPAASPSNVEDGLILECDKCKLLFDSKKALVVHTEKFCGKLDEILARQESRQESNQKKNAAKNYMTIEEV